MDAIRRAKNTPLGINCQGENLALCDYPNSPHAGKGKLKKVPKDSCQSCHDASYTAEKYMPNKGQTATGLFVRTHTFSKNPRKGTPGASDMPPLDYYE